MTRIPTDIRLKMDGMVEQNYAAFQRKLIFTSYNIEGIRLPELRAFCSSLNKDERESLYSVDELDSFEEVLLYGFNLGKLKNRDEVKKGIDFLLPRLDNWAHVDCILSSLKIIGKNREFFLAAYEPLKTDEGEFTKRFLAVMLMDYYLGAEDFERTAELMTQIKQGQYYTDMAVAWALSVMLVKNYDYTLEMLKNGGFSDFIYNKALQKAVESRRISDEQKAFLRSIKRK